MEGYVGAFIDENYQFDGQPTRLEEIFFLLAKKEGFLDYTSSTDHSTSLETSAFIDNGQKKVQILFQKRTTRTLMQDYSSLMELLTNPEEEIIIINNGSTIEIHYSNDELKVETIKEEIKDNKKVITRIPWEPAQTIDTILETLYPIIHPKKQRSLKGRK